MEVFWGTTPFLVGFVATSYRCCNIELAKIERWITNATFECFDVRYRLANFNQKFKPSWGWVSPKWDGYKSPKDYIVPLQLAATIGEQL